MRPVQPKTDKAHRHSINVENDVAVTAPHRGFLGEVLNPVLCLKGGEFSVVEGPADDLWVA